MQAVVRLVGEAEGFKLGEDLGRDGGRLLLGVVSAGAASVWASPLLNLSVNQLMSTLAQPESVNSSRVSARRTQRVRRMALTPFS